MDSQVLYPQAFAPTCNGPARSQRTKIQKSSRFAVRGFPLSSKGPSSGRSIHNKRGQDIPTTKLDALQARLALVESSHGEATKNERGSKSRSGNHKGIKSIGSVRKAEARRGRILERGIDMEAGTKNFWAMRSSCTLGFQVVHDVVCLHSPYDPSHAHRSYAVF